MTENVLVIDQGTTSTRAVVYGRSGRIKTEARRELRQIFPSPGLVELDPDDIWSDVLSVIRESSLGHQIAAVGIANQRETTILWDRNTGRPVHNAIVWQDRRTADQCQEIIGKGHERLIAERTGLVVDPYFSASKISWLLDNIGGLRERATRGDILFGTVDSYLIWRLSGQMVHATDATNASRTMLYNIHTGGWDQDLLDIWRIPPNLMPEVRDSAADFGRVREDLLSNSPIISGVAGDQQAATIGQACFEAGMLKSTFGTGAFLVLNTGDTPVQSTNQLLTTIAYQIGGHPTYALEGSIFNAGTAIQWLRDELQIIKNSGEVEWLAMQASDSSELVVVPAFTGLGAPHWRTDVLAAAFGITRDTGRSEFALAALEAVVYQTRELLNAMSADGAPSTSELRIDGGMSGNNLMAQMLADICDINVVRPRDVETTALGVAFLAAIGSGQFRDLREVKDFWKSDRTFSPNMASDRRDRNIARWDEAIRKFLA